MKEGSLKASEQRDVTDFAQRGNRQTVPAKFVPNSMVSGVAPLKWTDVAALARQSRVVETTWRTAGGCRVC